MRWLLPSIALLLAALCTAWLLDAGSTAPPIAPSETAFATADDGNRPDIATGDATDADERIDAETLPADLDREELPETVSAEGPQLQVVRGEGGPPVAGASVYFLDERRYRTLREQRDGLTRYEAPELLGQRRRSDDDGMVRLPGGSGRYLCSALHEGEYGYLVVRVRPGEHTLVLEPDEQLRIEARHSDGSPAAVPLAALQMDEADESETIWRGTSDAAGVAIVRHFQRLRDKRSRKLPEDVAERFAVAARIPGNPAALTEFAGRPASADPVLLQLPDLGKLEVQLVDHQGQPLLSPARVVAGIEGEPVTETGFPVSRGIVWDRIEKPAGPDPILFPFARVGQGLRLYARYPHDRRSARAENVAGPAAAGDTARLEIKPLERHCVIAGRLLGPDRRAIREDEVDITIWRDDTVLMTAEAQTITDGRFDVVVTGRKDEARFRIEFRYRAEGSGDTAPRQWLGAFVDKKQLQPQHRVDLGEVVLGVLPPVAAGIVVDDLGQPIANASVMLQQQRVSTRSSRGRAMTGTPGPASTLRLNFRTQGNGGNSQRIEWRNLPGLRVRTDGLGKFVIAGTMPPGTVRLRADSNQHFADSVPLERPNQNLRVELERNGTLEGRVKLPRWLPDRAVTLTMVPFEQERRKRDQRSTTLRRSRRGSFRIDPLRAGRYDLQVTMRNLKGPLVTIRDVFVKPEPTGDPRLAPLDLSRILFRYRLKALDQGGQPMKLDGPIKAQLHRNDGTIVESGFRWQNGRAELITAHELVDLTFFGRGFTPKQQQFLPGDHDVYLDTMQPALVNVPGARALCGPTRKVRISAILQGDTGYPSSLSGTDQRTGRRFSFARWDLGRSSGGWLEQSDVVQIPLMTAGKYQIILRAHATESTRSPQTSVTLGNFELKPDGVTMVTVPLDAAAVQKALEQIDKRHQQQLEKRRQRRR